MKEAIVEGTECLGERISSVARRESCATHFESQKWMEFFIAASRQTRAAKIHGSRAATSLHPSPPYTHSNVRAAGLRQMFFQISSDVVFFFFSLHFGFLS